MRLVKSLDELLELWRSLGPKWERYEARQHVHMYYQRIPGNVL